MTNNQPDRLDRIEATLERVSQQLDNQVVVNAELRQSTAELRQTTAQLTDAVNVLMSSVTTLTGVVSFSPRKLCSDNATNARNARGYAGDAPRYAGDTIRYTRLAN